MIDQILNSDLICVDTETTGLEWYKGHKVFGISISAPVNGRAALIADPLHEPVHSVYIDVRNHGAAMYRKIGKKLESAKLVVNHNIKFDLHMLANDNIWIPPQICQCTMIRAALLDEHRITYDLDSVARDCIKMRKDEDLYSELAVLFGGLATRNVQMKNLPRAPFSVVEKYANKDTEVALRLWAWQETAMERDGLAKVWDLERRLFPVVFDMERRGIRVDVAEAERVQNVLTKRIDSMQKDLNRMAGFEVNPNPSNSLHKLIGPKQDEDGNWYAKDGTPLEKTEKGAPSIGSDALEAMKMPEAKLILRLRKMIKTRDTFIGGHVLGHQVDGVVHPNINQTKGDGTGGTGTGRLSYTNPALQQIPARDKEIARMVRPIFLPDEGQGWSYGDLDQHELRIFHHYVNNPDIIRTYRENPDTDGHQAVADLTGLPRNAPKSGGANAKQINLAMVFNMGSGELADRLGLPYTIETFVDKNGVPHTYKKAGPEAQAIIDRYHEMVPGVKEMAIRASAVARARGYVKTLFGRHIRFPGGMFVHKASGLIYQGTAADLNKYNLINVSQVLQSICPDARILLNIHDEISLSIPRDIDYRAVLKEVQAVIQNRPEIRIPLRIDFSDLADNWWEATQL